MIKGLAITPPILGRISIGKVVERNGKRLPEKDDQFTITTQVQTKDGWVPHPLDEQLRKEAANGKLRSIPVQMLFNDPDLNLRAAYSLFDRNSGRPLCVGNGETCCRALKEGVQTPPLASSQPSGDGQGRVCKPYGRLHVKIGDDDELGTFIFRTTGFNSIRTLAARLRYYQAASGNVLACLPLELKLRGKSTTQSRRTPIYYVDLCLREGKALEAAIAEARTLNAKRQEVGFDQAALDEAARQGFGNASFEENEEELPAILEEFYPEAPTSEPGDSSPSSIRQEKPGLKERLGQRIQTRVA